MKTALLHLIFLFLFSSCLFSFNALRQMETVEIAEPQLAKSVAGIVTGPSGEVIPGVTVEERSDDWNKVLRSTETDAHGRFHLSARSKKTMYHLEFSSPGFDRVRIKLQLDKKADPAVTVKMPIAT